MAIGDGAAVGDGGVSLTSGQKMMKYSLFFISLVILIFGIVLVALGAAAEKSFASQLSSQTLPAGIIVMGVFIMVVALFGFFSAWREWRAGLGIYFGVVLLLSIILIAISIALYVEKDNASYYITQGWNSAGIDVRLSAMYTFNCCGLTDPSYNVYCGGKVPNPQTTQGSDVPTACCSTNGTGPAIPNPNAVTCLNLLSDDVKNYAVQVGGAGIAFSVLMLVGLVFIGLLMKGIRLKNLSLEVLKNRQRNEAERAERRKGIQLPDNVL